MSWAQVYGLIRWPPEWTSTTFSVCTLLEMICIKFMQQISSHPSGVVVIVARLCHKGSNNFHIYW